MLYLLMGLLRPSEGQILVDGADMSFRQRKAWKGFFAEDVAKVHQHAGSHNFFILL